MDDMNWVLNNCRVLRVDLQNRQAVVQFRGETPRTVELIINSKDEIWFEGVALCFPSCSKLLLGSARIANWIDDPENYAKLGKAAGYHKADWFLAASRTFSGKRTDLSIRGWYDEAENVKSDQRQNFAIRQKARSKPKRRN